MRRSQARLALGLELAAPEPGPQPAAPEARVGQAARQEDDRDHDDQAVDDVAAFLEGPPAFDDVRCASLLAGAVWARPLRLHAGRDRVPVPFAYAALKPVFALDADLRALRILPDTGQLPIPPGLVARLRRGSVDEAVRVALDRTRASGIVSAFSLGRGAADAIRLGTATDPTRLAAALLIPIDEDALSRLVTRAYPEALPTEETDNAA